MLFYTNGKGNQVKTRLKKGDIVTFYPGSPELGEATMSFARSTNPPESRILRQQNGDNKLFLGSFNKLAILEIISHSTGLQYDKYHTTPGTNSWILC
jgi:hypothetical protein